MHISTGRAAVILSLAFAGWAGTSVLVAVSDFAVAQDIEADSSGAARAGAIVHAQKMRRLFRDIDGDTQATPPIIPQLGIDPDPSGAIATYQPKGPTITANNAFFQDLGTNGRTCFTCHQPEDGWSLSAQHAQHRFHTNPNDPLFRLVDGATCPSDDVSTHRTKRKAYSLLLAKGLIRIGLPMRSPGLEFQIIDVNDPYGCNTDPTTGLTGSTTGTVSVYRGKVKGPILRGLGAPYFHNGSAATLADVVELYNQRFDIGLTDQQKADLVAFLSAL
jgi:hypothetical protein